MNQEIKSLAKAYSNDQELGAQFRASLGKQMPKLTNSIPNDQSLGKVVRELASQD